MDPERKVIELLKNLSKKGDCFFYATVTEVQELTCSVIISDLELTDVRLKATTLEDEDKLVITPFKGSKVIVGSNNGDLRDLMILKVDDPEKIFYKHKDITIDIDGSSGKIVINEGGNGGLVIVGKTTQRLNKIEKDINDLKQVFKTWTPTPNDGGAALKSASATWFGANLVETKDEDIENTDIKH